MKITLITPGTGSFYCGVCLRDNALATELRARGHEATIIPMYLPVTTDEKSVAAEMPIFFGGINVYLQQHFKIFRHTPEWIDRMFDSRFLLKMAAQRSGMTQGADLGELTLSMIQGEEGNQSKEVKKLVRYLIEHDKPDVILLSTALQLGLLRRIRESLGVPVGCYLQGEDVFLDTLRPPHDKLCWEELGKRARESDALIAPSRYFGDLMAERMGLKEGSVRVIPNGVRLDEYKMAAEPPTVPTIGYFGRMMPGKGLHTVVDAFIELKQDSAFAHAKLKVAGAATPVDADYIAEQRRKLTEAGVDRDVTLETNVSRETKLRFYQEISVFSVPVNYGEAFGLFLIEAMAAGVPVVQPRHGAFPELVEATGGGLICEPDDPKALAASWKELLADPERARHLGQAGRKAALEHYSVATMADATVRLAQELAKDGVQGQAMAGADS